MSRVLKSVRSNPPSYVVALLVAVVFGARAVAARAGGNVKKFSGRIGRRALKPGRYRVMMTATDVAGNESAPVT